MKATLFIAATAFVSSAFAAPQVQRHVRHERRDAASLDRLAKRNVLEPTFRLPMRIGLAQTNLHRGHDWLLEVSDPNSPKYGQHYTAEEVHDLFAPSSDSVAAVRAWIEGSGIAAERISLSTNKQWLQFDAETQEAEALLKTKYYAYEDGSKTSIGCDEYSVHESVQPHIDYVTPGIKTIEFVSDLFRRSANADGKGMKPIRTVVPKNTQFSATSLKYCKEYITPACIAALYNITAAPKTVQKGNELGIFEETAQYVAGDDLNLFFQHVAPNVPQGTFPIVHDIDGAKNQNNEKRPGDEAMLDFEIAYPIIYPQQTVLWLTDSVDAEAEFRRGFFNTFLDAIDGSYCNYTAFGVSANNTFDPTYPTADFNHTLQCGVFKPTNVISFSYELAEFNEGVSEGYQKRQCNEYMKLGLQGVSVVFASGDSGVESAFNCGGTSDDVKFNPNFPSSCPYVTSVGATTLNGNVLADQERAVNQFPTGGGFSNYFPRPSYQASAVATYFKSPAAPTYPYYTNGSGTGYYNRDGRGYPDVSAVGQAVLNWYEGEPYVVGGTSASAPIFASILNRINEERLAAGKSTVGFVNPMLYQNPQVFHDITVGTNPGCGTQGFSAGKGWDPLTGLGTPNYPELLAAFMKS